METPTPEVRREHQALERLLPFLRDDVKNSPKHCGLFHDDGLVGIFDCSDKAWDEGMRMFGFNNFRVVLLRPIELNPCRGDVIIIDRLDEAEQQLAANWSSIEETARANTLRTSGREVL